MFKTEEKITVCWNLEVLTIDRIFKLIR